MKRTEKRERTIGRSDRNHATKPSADRRALLLTCSAVLVGVSLWTGSGCHSLFSRGFENGRYLDGSDATSDWNRARMESVDDSTKTGSVERNVSTTTRGAVRDPSSTELPDVPQKSWSEKMMDSIRRPFTTKNKQELELENELRAEDEKRRLAQEKRRPTPREAQPEDDASSVRPSLGEKTTSSVEVTPNVEAAPSTRSVSSSSDYAREEKQESSSSFWGRVFPFNKPARQEDDDLIGSRSGLIVQKSASSSAASSASKGKSGLTGEFAVFRKSSRNKPWNRPGLAVEQYKQSNFLPPMKTIEAYYSAGSVAVDPRANARSESLAYGGADSFDVDDQVLESRTATIETPVVEKTAALPQGSYRSSSYAPIRSEGANTESNDDNLPESPANNRSGYLGGHGAASLTPISSYESGSNYNKIAQTSGVVRSSSLGKTRQITASGVSSNGSGVVSTSFEERRGAFSASDSMEETPQPLSSQNGENSVASSVPSNVRYSNDSRDVDENFRDSLGQKTSYDWFHSEQTDDSALADELPSLREDVGNTPADQSGTLDLVDDQSFGSELSANDASAQEQTPSPSELSRNLEWSDSKELPNVDSAFSNALADPVDGELDLDSIVDGAIANSDLSELAEDPRQEMFSNSVVTGGTIGSDLANAIMKSVDVDDTLDHKATALSESAPESVDARKADTTTQAAPLTQEEIAWIEQIKNAIQSLLKEREEHKRRGDDVRICDARLRLLYLVIGEYERSIQEIQDESDPLRNFWEKECRGLETLLQNQLEEIDPTFVAERLRSGLDSLSGLCQLRIRKMLLVEAPACYGLFEERNDPYEAGEALYAYSELDYVTSRESDEGFSIDVECRWRLLSANGTPLTPFETQRCSNLSETKLRDVVLNVSVPLPEDLEPGVCLLELEVSDLNAAKPETCVQRLTVRIADDAEANGYVSAEAM